MDPIILRLLERIFSVAVGAFSIYLGYLLFLKLPEKTDSQGRFILPGNVSIHLSRVGPGVFFALFGSFIIALLCYYGRIEYEETKKGKAPSSSVSTSGDPAAQESILVARKFLGAVPEPGDLEAPRQKLKKTIILLNRLPAELKPDMDAALRVDILKALPSIKVSLMLNQWDHEWGDAGAFAQWVMKKGAQGPPPPELVAAVEIFSSER
jgi:hypothetical protein